MKNTAKVRALTALLLSVPAPTIGVVFSMYLYPDMPIGKTVFFISKVWFFLFPAVWYLFIEKKHFSWSAPHKGGWHTGWITGVIISTAIIVTFILWGNSFIDSSFKTSLQKVGLDSPLIYSLGALYWIAINSVLEEYAWRWFVTKKCAKLTPPIIAVLLSAALFTLHHIFAIGVYLPPVAVIICSTGIFIGGVLWSWMYKRYESIWPAYLNHAIVDLAVFGIGAYILFW